MHVKKQELELDVQQQTGSKLAKEYIKTVYCHLRDGSLRAWQVPGDVFSLCPWQGFGGEAPSRGSLGWQRPQEAWVSGLSQEGIPQVVLPPVAWHPSLPQQ